MMIGPVDVVHGVWLTTPSSVGRRCAGGFLVMEGLEGRCRWEDGRGRVSERMEYDLG